MRDKSTLEGESQLIAAFHKDQSILHSLALILTQFDDVFNARVLKADDIHYFTNSRHAA